MLILSHMVLFLQSACLRTNEGWRYNTTFRKLNSPRKERNNVRPSKNLSKHETLPWLNFVRSEASITNRLCCQLTGIYIITLHIITKHT
jgi:hypothetical protein